MIWSSCRFEEIVEFHDHHRIPLGTLERDKRQGEYRYYGAQGVIDHIDDFIFDGEYVLIAEDGANLVTRNQPIAQIARGQFWVNNHAHVVRAKDGVSTNYFVNTLINSMNLTGYVTGAAQPKLSQKNLRIVEVSIPPVDIQQKISEILSAYDDLIENNRRRIELLEQSARLLYKEWFVHLRFPGHEHTTIMNGVPDGWEKKTLSELADITMGQSPKSTFYNQEGVGLPFHQGVSNFGNRFPTHEIFCTIKKRLAQAGDILFSVRAPVGRINIAPDELILGRGLAGIRSKYGHQNFLFYSLKNHFFKEDMIGGGAIFAAITKKDLHNVELMVPTESLVQLFIDSVESIDKQVECLQKTIAQLAQGRDLLLPRLMNGEIPV